MSDELQFLKLSARSLISAVWVNPLGMDQSYKETSEKRLTVAAPLTRNILYSSDSMAASKYQEWPWSAGGNCKHAGRPSHWPCQGSTEGSSQSSALGRIWNRCGIQCCREREPGGLALQLYSSFLWNRFDYESKASSSPTKIRGPVPCPCRSNCCMQTGMLETCIRRLMGTLQRLKVPYFLLQIYWWCPEGLYLLLISNP